MKMKIETSDLLDRIFAEYNDEMQIPDGAFTVNEYARKFGFTRGKATYQVTQMLRSGKLKRKKIGTEHYYYE
ncbi:hypothetical protein LCGC14_1189400 [marine sediment metagenome]|uniref:MarR family transcriptional regulator n=1 Tax=marine sediment metagenome TaxID=412755 RepID=A0A0F9PQ96_9ZZZZ